jgi:hypothetical protein
VCASRAERQQLRGGGLLAPDQVVSDDDEVDQVQDPGELDEHLVRLGDAVTVHHRHGCVRRRDVVADP